MDCLHGSCGPNSIFSAELGHWTSSVLAQSSSVCFCHSKRKTVGQLSWWKDRKWSRDRVGNPSSILSNEFTREWHIGSSEHFLRWWFSDQVIKEPKAYRQKDLDFWPWSDLTNWMTLGRWLNLSEPSLNCENGWSFLCCFPTELQVSNRLM